MYNACICMYILGGMGMQVWVDRESVTLRQEKLGFYIKRSQPAQCKYISPTTEGTLFFLLPGLDASVHSSCSINSFVKGLNIIIIFLFKSCLINNIKEIILLH